MSTKVTVIGAGLVGRAWAITFARAGHEVALFDADPAAAAAAVDFVASIAEELAAADQLRGLATAAILRQIRPTHSLEEALAGTTHVQENTPERLDTKIAVFRLLDASTPVDVPIASSTSGLLPSSFTEDLPGGARCLVAHPINPPYLIPAVEIVPGPRTSPETVERVRALMVAIGQSPIVLAREIDGFIMNRLQSAVLHEAFRLVAEGYAKMEDVDVGIRDGLGLRWAFMGPFETIDLNAPRGIADYVSRFGEMYERLWHSQNHQVDWMAPASAMAEELEGVRPRSALASRQVWRDRRLIALLTHKRWAREAFGD